MAGTSDRPCRVPGAPAAAASVLGLLACWSGMPVRNGAARARYRATALCTSFGGVLRELRAVMASVLLAAKVLRYSLAWLFASGSGVKSGSMGCSLARRGGAKR